MIGCLGPWLIWNSTPDQDRKSTRLNSSHSQISYAVFCLKKKINDVNGLVAGEAIERRPLLTSYTAARIFFPCPAAIVHGPTRDAAILQVHVDDAMLCAAY